ncbi:MAG: molybdopterin molybdotransferase MoeA [Candidatus Bipolaricaulota bacterium]
MVKDAGFQSLLRSNKALSKLLRNAKSTNRKQQVPVDQARNRVLSSRLKAPRNIPHYDRAAMDGFAVRAEDTFGATQSSPRRLKLRSALVTAIEDGEAVKVNTGAALPKGTDAVLKVESARETEQQVEALNPVSPKQNVGAVGEDVQKGEVILKKDRKLDPPALSLLRSLGIEKVSVWKKPKITVIPTGEELIPPGNKPVPGEVIESNGLMVKEYVSSWEGKVALEPCYSDQTADLLHSLSKHEGEPLIIMIGGSSVGERDQATEALSQLGSLLFHGVAIQPGKPLCGAVLNNGSLVVCLPGYPVAALVDSLLFLKPVLEKMTRVTHQSLDPEPSRFQLGEKIHSKLGMLTVTRVRLSDEKLWPIRTAGAGILTSATASDGFVLVPEDSEGKAAGTEIKLHTWDQPPDLRYLEFN